MAKLKRVNNHACHGSIRFEFDSDGDMAIRLGWNPGSLTRGSRKAIAKELRQIADHVDIDQFENNGVYQHYPIT